MCGSSGVRPTGPISRRRCGLAGQAIAEARPAYHRPGKRIDGEKYKERSELFTPGANFSAVYADEEIDLPFAKSHAARMTGLIKLLVRGAGCGKAARPDL